MNNYTKYLKRISGLCVMLCMFLCLAACGKGKEDADKAGTDKTSGREYVVTVSDDNNESLEGVSVMLYDKDGQELIWLPVATNFRGKVDFSKYGREGCYVQIKGAPAEYLLDTEKKFYFDKTGTAKVVLEKDIYHADLQEYEATVGKGKYSTLAEAVDVANAAQTEVTISLASDVTIKELGIGNIFNNTLIVDGNGHTITTEGGNNAFQINQTSGTVEFRNVKFNHKNTGSVIQVAKALTVNLTNVDIKATEGKAYNYALINTTCVEETTNLNLSGVNVKMSAPGLGKDGFAGVIRTGNGGYFNIKYVNITMDNCNFDTSGATKRCGIVIMDTTVATMDIKNTTFTTGDTFAIRASYQPITLNNVTFKCKSADYASKPIQDIGKVDSNKKEQVHKAIPVVRVGDQEYESFHAALIDVNKINDDVVIEVLEDFKVRSVTVRNEKDHDVTIEGNGHTITTEDGNNAFLVTQESGTVEFKNMTINHTNYGSVFQNSGTNTLALTDVVINATKGKAYYYCLINLIGSGDTTYLNCNRVKITMAVESSAKDLNASIIRTGNGGEEDTKTVMISLTDCTFDTRGAKGRAGIMIMPTTTAYLVLNNTTIRTKNNFPIRANHQAGTLKNCKLSAETGLFSKNLIENGENIIKK